MSPDQMANLLVEQAQLEAFIGRRMRLMREAEQRHEALFVRESVLRSVDGARFRLAQIRIDLASHAACTCSLRDRVLGRHASACLRHVKEVMTY